MTETIFKKGDTVEVDNIYGHTHDNRVGAKGTITEVRGGGTAYYVRVENEDNARFGQTLVFYPNELKLVKPEQKFQVGDWVKVKGRDDEWDGSVCVITESLRGSGNFGRLYAVNIESGTETGPAHFFECDLEATDAPKPAPKFKKGDIVKSVGFQFMRFEGKTLIICGESTDEGYDYKVRALGEDWVVGHCFREDELVAGEPLAEWEIELLDYRPGKKALVDYPVALVKDIDVAALTIAKNEAVKHPAHYGGGDNPYEAIKVIEAWGLGFNLGNAAKYLARAGKKGNKVEDLNKLIQYVQFEIAKEEAK